MEKYIRESRQRARSDDLIRTTLLNAGWKIEEINAALSEIPRDPHGFDTAKITIISKGKSEDEDKN